MAELVDELRQQSAKLKALTEQPGPVSIHDAPYMILSDAADELEALRKLVDDLIAWDDLATYDADYLGAVERFVREARELRGRNA